MRLHMEAKKISYFLSYSRATQKPHVCSAAGYKKGCDEHDLKHL